MKSHPFWYAKKAPWKCALEEMPNKIAARRAEIGQRWARAVQCFLRESIFDVRVTVSDLGSRRKASQGETQRLRILRKNFMEDSYDKDGTPDRSCAARTFCLFSCRRQSSTQRGSAANRGATKKKKFRLVVICFV